MIATDAQALAAQAAGLPAGLADRLQGATDAELLADAHALAERIPAEQTMSERLRASSTLPAPPAAWSDPQARPDPPAEGADAEPAAPARSDWGGGAHPDAPLPNEAMNARLREGR